MTSDTKGGRCAEWLVQLLKENGPMRPKKIVDMGLEEGYARSMIHRARAKMPEIMDTRGRQHPDNQWKLDPSYEPPAGRSAEEQIIELNDWLATHEPDLYWGTPGLDTATVVIQALERRPSRGRLMEMLAAELGVIVEVG